jgi:hypothetical protein
MVENFYEKEKRLRPKNRKMAVFCVAASIIRAMTALMMEAASTSERLVNFYQTTRRKDPQDSLIHTRRSENLKYHLIIGTRMILK